MAKVMPILAIMALLDWAGSSRQGPWQQAHSSQDGVTLQGGTAGLCRAARTAHHNAGCTGTALGHFGQHAKSTGSASTRRALQQPPACPAVVPAHPHHSRALELRERLARSNINGCTQQPELQLCPGAGGIPTTHQGMTPWRYSPTLSTSITRRRCSGTRKMFLLERKFTVSWAAKALTEKPLLVRDFLS